MSEVSWNIVLPCLLCYSSLVTFFFAGMAYCSALISPPKSRGLINSITMGVTNVGKRICDGGPCCLLIPPPIHRWCAGPSSRRSTIWCWCCWSLLCHMWIGYSRYSLKWVVKAIIVYSSTMLRSSSQCWMHIYRDVIDLSSPGQPPYNTRSIIMMMMMVIITFKGSLYPWSSSIHMVVNHCLYFIAYRHISSLYKLATP